MVREVVERVDVGIIGTYDAGEDAGTGRSDSGPIVPTPRCSSSNCNGCCVERNKPGPCVPYKRTCPTPSYQTGPYTCQSQLGAFECSKCGEPGELCCFDRDPGQSSDRWCLDGSLCGSDARCG